MKRLILCFFLITSFSSNAAFFGLFGPKNPLEITDYDERIQWLKDNDRDFQNYLKEKEAEQKEIEDHNKKILAKLDEEFKEAQTMTPEVYQERRLALRKQKQDQLNRNQMEIEQKAMKSWVVINNKFVNIEEEKRKKEQEEKEQKEMERVRKFQKEEGLDVTPIGSVLKIFE